MIKKLMKLRKIIEAGRIFLNSEYLTETGWWNSYRAKLPIDKSGQPLPWVTYSFIDFITDRLNNDLSIFEFGSGYSTLFYATRVNKVIAAEHDENWYNQMKDRMGRNVEILFRHLEYNGAYCRTAAEQSIKFDIIIVDGRDRVNCMIHSPQSLTDRGVVVVDDSERKQYQKGLRYLQDQGYRKLDFWGMAPGLTYRKCTSVLYKPNNCLSI